MESGTRLIQHATHGLIWLVATACGTSPQRDAPSRTEPAGTVQPSPVGRWMLEVSPEPATGTPRVRMELQLDSVRGTQVFGRLTSYVAGNVGIDPTAFPRLDGRMSDGDYVTLEIGHEDPAVSGFVLAGPLSGDTIALDLLVIGPDTTTGRSREWKLVRHPPGS